MHSCLILYGSLSYRKTHQTYRQRYCAPAIPAVADDAKPAKEQCDKDSACWRSMRGVVTTPQPVQAPLLQCQEQKNTATANKIMAELIIQPLPIDNRVSRNS